MPSEIVVGKMVKMLPNGGSFFRVLASHESTIGRVYWCKSVIGEKFRTFLESDIAECEPMRDTNCFRAGTTAEGGLR